MDKKILEPVFDAFERSRIMVVGDIMLDEYLEGTVDRISPEAPIPVVNLVNNRTRDVRFGGAANVFNNLASLGGRDIYLCGVVGSDENGALVKEKMRELGVSDGGIVVDAARPTIVKTRIIAHNQQVIRLDREERSPVGAEARSQLAGFIIERLESLDAIIFSDYEKGVITRELLEEVLPLAAEHNVLVAVDPKFANFRYFNNVTIVVPNRKEASGYYRHEINSEEDELRAARYILESLESRYVLLKLGEKGMRLIDREGCDVKIETAAEQVYDVTGAGDTVISTLVMARTAGASWEDAARVANVAAGIVIHFVGTSAVTVAQLKNAIFNNRFPKP
ncbi:MAG: D-glycero-beta-D-manno-heptose-7-phosphate kinase [Deltaproteobacteria bacterium]|nr:D-glycero-beta-D-manno-heptose-7-phosphate kinase [Deltaproteobacteria bacterium]